MTPAEAKRAALRMGDPSSALPEAFVPRGALTRYAVAATCVAVAIALRLAFPLPVPQSIYLYYFVAVILAAWYGGLGPGLFATALSLLAGNYFADRFHWGFSLRAPAMIARMITFAVQGVLLSVLNQSLHVSRRRALEAQRATETARHETAVALEDTRRGAAIEDDLRARLAAVVEVSGDAIITVDRAGRIASWNGGAERMFGWRADEAIGRDADLMSPDGAGEAKAFVERLLRGERVGPIAVERMARDGRRLQLSLAASPLLDRDGHVTGGAAILRDVSGIKRAEDEIHRLNRDLEQRVSERTAELQDANRELEAFTYSVSHDLRAPLRGLEGFSRILLEDYAGRLDAEAARYLGMIRANAERMALLIDDLLRLSRFARQPLEHTSVDVEALVREVIESLKPELEGRRVEFRVGPLPPVEADRALLKQVWVNLVSNAVKYTRPRDPAHVEIGAEPDPGGREATVYFVRDDGVGFDMRYATKLFTVFQRMHRAEEYEGTGVGLAIAHRIIARHGGRIWVETAPDRGATFRFTLGRAATPQAVDPAA